MNPEIKDIDFYEFLGLDRLTLPAPSSKEDRLKLKLILDDRFKHLAPKMHPDRGGSNELFKLLLRAVTVLGDEKLRAEYDGTNNESFNNVDFKVDWEKYYTYSAGSLAADFGDIFSHKISEMIGVSISFYPTQKEHGYNWVFDYKHNDKPLTMSLVYDEDEILHLTDGDEVEKSLPFKIHLFFPMDTLSVHYDHTTAMKVPGSSRYVIMPIAKSIQYSDIVLISTTSDNNFLNYIENNICSDLNQISSGNYQNQDVDLDTKAGTDQKTFRQQDLEMLNSIFKIKTQKLEEAPDGDQFINLIPIKPIKRISEVSIKTHK